MKPAPFDLSAELVADPDNRWSIGSFGATGEFGRSSDENADIFGVPRQSTLNSVLNEIGSTEKTCE